MAIELPTDPTLCEHYGDHDGCEHRDLAMYELYDNREKNGLIFLPAMRVVWLGDRRIGIKDDRGEQFVIRLPRHFRIEAMRRRLRQAYDGWRLS